jgi:hypothetical protein
MTKIKVPMSTSYKAVFVLSILMIIIAIIEAAMSGNKIAFVGTLYWVYSAWKMFKRDNESLVKLQIIMLWLEALLLFFYFGVMIFSDSYAVHSYADITPLFIFIILPIIFSILINYNLLIFFKKQNFYDSSAKYNPSANASMIDDKHWDAASNELASNINQAAWAKSFAMSEGDEAKAKAMYLRNRAFDLMQIEKLRLAQESSRRIDSTSNNSFDYEIFWAVYLRPIVKITLFGIICLLVYAMARDDEQTLSSENSVSELLRRTTDGSIIVREMRAEIIENESDIYDKPWIRLSGTLPFDLVHTVEAKNIWWDNDGKFYIRLYNPSGVNLISFNFSISKSNCPSNSEVNRLISFDLKDAPLPPYSYGVYSANWPFDYYNVLGPGPHCGIVTRVIIQK